MEVLTDSFKNVSICNDLSKKEHNAEKVREAQELNDLNQSGDYKYRHAVPRQRTSVGPQGRQIQTKA